MQPEIIQTIEEDLKNLQTKYNWMIKIISSSIYNGGYDPDINGFTIIYFIPPDFSAYSKDINNEIANISKKMVFLATDFIPPDIQVNIGQYGAATGNNISYPTAISRSGNLSINYIENSNQDVFTFHNFWVEYMSGIIKGKIKPDDSFLNDEYPIIDYVGASYVIKFNKNMSKITYIGKATGIFPLALTSKQIFGDRSKNEISLISVNYSCMRFDNATLGLTNINATNKLSMDIFNEFAIQVQ